MLEKIINNKFKIALILGLITLLAVIRAYEETLFYDPFIAYFKSDYLSVTLPKYDNFRLFLG